MIPLECFSATPTVASMSPSDAKAARAEGGTLTPFMDELRQRAHTALGKALKKKPSVRHLLSMDWPIPRRYYSVIGASGEYLVTLVRDRDSHWWGSCTCPAGDPPASEHTGVIEWHPTVCYHVAAVLIQSVKTVQATEARAAARKSDSGATF